MRGTCEPGRSRLSSFVRARLSGFEDLAPRGLTRLYYYWGAGEGRAIAADLSGGFELRSIFGDGPWRSLDRCGLDARGLNF